MGSCLSLDNAYYDDYPPSRRNNGYYGNGVYGNQYGYGRYGNNRPEMIILGSPRYSNNNPMCNPYNNGPQFLDNTFMGPRRGHHHNRPPPMFGGGGGYGGGGGGGRYGYEGRGGQPKFCDPNPRFCEPVNNNRPPRFC